MVVPELDVQGGVTAHRLQLGWLDSAVPTHELSLPAVPTWPGALPAERAPVVAGPVAGVVLYVADVESASHVWVTDAGGTSDRELSLVDDVVFTAAFAPDASAVYLVLLDRATGSDLGVFRVSLTAAGPPEQLMPPPPEVIGPEPRIVLTAVNRFIRVLRLSPDGVDLARFACGDPFGACRLDVLDLRTDATRTFVDPAPTELIAVGDDHAFGDIDCSAGPCNRRRALDLRTGGWIVVAPVEGEDAVVVGDDGQLMHLAAFGNFDPAGTAALKAVDTRSGATSTPISIEGSIWLGSEYQELQAEVPRGWALVRVCREERPCTAVALRLADGEQVDVELPEPIAIGGGHD